jgi:hypothetical protein
MDDQANQRDSDGLSRWLVLRYVPSAPSSWVEVENPNASAYDLTRGVWLATDAAAAFALAVVNNERERVQTTSYQVLPFDGGVVFNVSMNVEAVVR